MNFHNINLPAFIAICAQGGPLFITDCAISASGREVRTSTQVQNKQSYKISGCKLSNEQFYQFNSFFRARGGQRFSFLLKDYVDYEVKNQFIAKGDGRMKEVELYKLYDDPIATYVRKITKPRSRSLKLSIDGIETSAYELNNINGCITLASPLLANSILTANFEFDVEVRFTQDSFSYNHCADGSVELIGVELIEVSL